MTKFYSLLAIFIFSMGIFINGWAANPCRGLAEACMKQGYYKGGNKVGKGLAENCMMPVISKQKTLPNTNFSDSELQQCKSILMKKMQNS